MAAPFGRSLPYLALDMEGEAGLEAGLPFDFYSADADQRESNGLFASAKIMKKMRAALSMMHFMKSTLSSAPASLTFSLFFVLRLCSLGLIKRGSGSFPN